MNELVALAEIDLEQCRRARDVTTDDLGAQAGRRSLGPDRDVLGGGGVERHRVVGRGEELVDQRASLVVPEAAEDQMIDVRRATTRAPAARQERAAQDEALAMCRARDAAEPSEHDATERGTAHGSIQPRSSATFVSKTVYSRMRFRTA